MKDNKEPSTIYANKVVEFVNQIFKAQGNNPRALGLGVGLNVNFPKVGYENETCTNPKWVFTRLTGQYAAGANLVYNETSNSFTWGQKVGMVLLFVTMVTVHYHQKTLLLNTPTVNLQSLFSQLTTMPTWV